MTDKPHCAAHYWAKMIATQTDNDIPDGWEVVQTFINSNSPFELRVFVPGQSESEPLDNFEWGPRVIAPPGCVPVIG
jgi:hypothetical protein